MILVVLPRRRCLPRKGGFLLVWEPANTSAQLPTAGQINPFCVARLARTNGTAVARNGYARAAASTIAIASDGQRRGCHATVGMPR